MIFSVIFILLIIFGIGLPTALMISPRMNILERFGISFLFGVGIFTLAMYLGNLLGFRLNLINIGICLFVLSFLSVFVGRKSIWEFFTRVGASVKKTNLSRGEKILLVVLVFLVISSFMNTFYWPVYSWDSLTLYDFRAKVFSQTGFIKDAMIGTFYISYPLLTSLAHSIVYLTGGNNPQFIYSLFYLSLGLCFYGLLREFLARKLSLLFTFMLLTVPLIFNHSLISYTNLPYTAYLSLGVLYFYVWYAKRKRGYLILSAILVGLSVWTRSAEPYWLGVFAAVLLISLFRKKFIDVIIYSLFLLPIQRAWTFYQNGLSDTGSGAVERVVGSTNSIMRIVDLSKWSQVVNFLYQNVFRPWGTIIIVFVLVTVLSIFGTRQKPPLVLVFITLVLLFILLAGTMAYSFSVATWMQLGDAVNRTSMVFYPLFIYCIALALGGLAKYDNQ